MAATNSARGKRRQKATKTDTPRLSARDAAVPALARPSVDAQALGIDNRTQLGRMGGMASDVAQRTTPGLPHMRVVRRDLQRWYALLADGRERLMREITADDWTTLRAALAGIPFTSVRDVRMLWAHVLTHLDPQGDGQAASIEHPLVARVRALSVGELWALVDALESWPTPDAGAPVPTTHTPAAAPGPEQIPTA